MHVAISLREALSDPALLGNTLAGESWAAWRTLLIASMGERLDDSEREIFKQLTGGREHEPGQRVEEFAGIIGRRGGKSRAISVLATYLSGLVSHPSLVAGERGVVLCVAPDQNQADITLNYCDAAFRQSPVLAQLINSRTQRSLKLNNGIDIEVRASDFRRLRGPTYCAVIADECAFWLSDNSSNPDSEILNAVRPGLATTGGSLFLISSPYARKGELWRTYQKHYGPHGDPLVLVVQGDTRTFNPSLPQSVIDRAYERDEAAASAEYGAKFRTDIESFVSIEAVRGCISRNVYERAPLPVCSYVAFVDPSGGSVDSMTLAIGHNDFVRSTVVLDAIREVKPPFSPEAVVESFAKSLQAYRVVTVTGDRYGGEWPREQFSKLGITYEPAEKPKSELYTDLLPLINSGRIALLDSERLVSQLTGLERRTSRAGRDSVDHVPGGHDDLCNAVAGMASLANRYGGFDSSYAWVAGAEADDRASAAREHRRQRIDAIMRGELDSDGSQAHPTMSNENLRRIAQPLRLGILR